MAIYQDPVSGLAKSTANVVTVASSVGFSESWNQPNKCAVVFLAHRPKSGDQATFSLSTASGDIIHFGTKLDGFGGTVAMYAFPDLGGNVGEEFGTNNTVAVSISFDKTVDTTLVIQRYSGVSLNPKGIRAEWSRGDLNNSVVPTPEFFEPNNREIICSTFVVENGSASFVTSNVYRWTDHNFHAGKRIGVFAAGGSGATYIFPDNPKIEVSSSAYLAASFTLFGENVIDVSTASGRELANEREKHLKRIAEEASITDAEKKKKVAESEAVVEEGAASMEGEIAALEQQTAEEQRARLDEHRNVIANIIEAMQEQRRAEVAEQQRYYEEQQAKIAAMQKLRNEMVAAHLEELRKKEAKEEAKRVEEEQKRMVNMAGRGQLLSILRKR